MESFAILRKSYGISALVTLLLLGAGIGVGYLWFLEYPDSVSVWGNWLQLISGAFFLSGVLGLLGWEIQSWKGGTPVETLDTVIFKSLHCTGMFILFTSSAALIFVG